ncbi:MAG TPA: BrnT family toxin [Rectinemataceae bacterium]|nr:BrnT family toxin [Rectinemataceae bacterium]
MVFEWDEAKNLANLRKHGLSFELARSVFADPLALFRLDLGAHGEEL